MKIKLFLSILTGILFALSFPPFRSGFLAYGALIPLFYLLRNQSLKETLRWGYLTGLFIYCGTLFWIGYVTMPGLIGALLVLPLYIMLYSFIQRLILIRFPHKGFLFLPFVWTAIEYLQSFGDIAFPWVYLGYTQSYYLPIIQFAEYTSVFGVSFWVVCLNVLLYELLFGFSGRSHRKLFLWILPILFFLPLLFGVWVLAHAPAPTDSVRIALIQGNIDPFEKWNPQNNERIFSTYDSLTRSALQHNPDLIVWPETATPFYLRSEYRYQQMIRHWVDGHQVPLLTGSIDYEYSQGRQHYFNSALMIRPNELNLAVYAKMRLVPFSEKVPFSDFLPVAFLRDWLMQTPLGVGDYSRGNRYTLFQLTNDFNAESMQEKRGAVFGVPICYESAFPDLVRRFVKRGATFLVVITNDAWFGRTSAPFQHQQISVLRAVETRKSIARCANTGISCFIDPYGRTRASTPLFQTATVVENLELCHSSTVYVRYGNIFAAFCLCIASLVLLTALIRFRSLRIRAVDGTSEFTNR
ncbi:apolipoprotein N-acyltransferase [candidate division KSB1 bacterium]|nr:apolipoprotein N-acyltransferase [candidate division KSB1 bacterium]